MKVVARTGREDLAMVYLAELEGRGAIEFVESLQPPHPIEKKWVLILSTLIGCPVDCPMCDAGGFYKGKLSKEEILQQIDYLVSKRFPDKRVAVEKFKIQFARMGDPAFNPGVLEVLEELPSLFDAPGLMPCVSTVAPSKAEGFFDKLLEIKTRLYDRRFQMQFSIHSTDPVVRDRLIPVDKWDLTHIADYGRRFFGAGGRKIALNFALEKSAPVDANVLRSLFDPDVFMIKITPLNPTYSAARNQLKSLVEPHSPQVHAPLVEELKDRGYEVIVSIGELDENHIGSNCGQLVLEHAKKTEKTSGAYGWAKPTTLT